MPIEIKELRIKVIVQDENVEEQDGGKKLDTMKLQELKSEIVKECLQKVLEKIKEKSER